MTEATFPRKPEFNLKAVNDLEPANYPITLQQIEQFYEQFDPETVNIALLRFETIKRIEAETGRALLCYISSTDLPPNFPQNLVSSLVSISDNDLEGFDNLIDTTITQSDKANIDLMVVSNGGSAEAAERIVNLLHQNFDTIRFIAPSNAYSAATMISFACDEILMTDTATLGPIDPQINGIPARTILRGFEDLEERLKMEGPEALTAYIHLLNGYSLHLLEVCKSAEALSRELAEEWLSKHMFKNNLDKSEINKIVDYFANYDLHKSHARMIEPNKAKELGLKADILDRRKNLTRLIRSLYYQYVFFFRHSPFVKVFENNYGTAYGRQIIQIPPPQNMRISPAIP